jgi:hypothetical protein
LRTSSCYFSSEDSESLIKKERESFAMSSRASFSSIQLSRSHRCKPFPLKSLSFSLSCPTLFSLLCLLNTSTLRLIQESAQNPLYFKLISDRIPENFFIRQFLVLRSDVKGLRFRDGDVFRVLQRKMEGWGRIGIQANYPRFRGSPAKRTTHGSVASATGASILFLSRSFRCKTSLQ